MGPDSINQALVVDLEKKLLDPLVRASKEQIESLLDDEFLEIGASGNRYTKSDILSELASEALTEQDLTRAMKNVSCKSLSESHILLTYSCEVRRNTAPTNKISSYEISWSEPKSLQHKYSQQLLQYYVKYFQPELPEVIWHYTSVESLNAILKSNGLWFTQIGRLNDSSEGMHSVHYSKLVIDACLQNNDNERHVKLLNAMKPRMLTSNADSTWYTFSLSRLKDDKGQWKEYGYDYQGVAIGFDSRELLRFLSQSKDNRPFICNVTYDIDKTIEFGRLVLSNGLNNFDEDFSTPPVEVAIENFLSVWGRQVDAFSVAFKTPFYEAEGEWRLARQLATVEDYAEIKNHNGVKRWPQERGTQSDSAMSILPITDVVLGPKFNGSQDDIQAILTSYGHFGVTVTRSNGPVRKLAPPSCGGHDLCTE